MIMMMVIHEHIYGSGSERFLVSLSRMGIDPNPTSPKFNRDTHIKLRLVLLK